MEKIEATPEQIAAAFTEWERRWRENPEQFESDSVRLAKAPESEGEFCARYFLKILDEVKA